MIDLIEWSYKSDLCVFGFAFIGGGGYDAGYALVLKGSGTGNAYIAMPPINVFIVFFLTCDC